MARRLQVSLTCLTLCIFGTLSAAQPAPSTKSALAKADSAAPVTLGDSVVPLNGPWKFHIGDSPIDPQTGNPLWAEPGFDDSTWENVDLTPKSGSFDPVSGISNFVPGWTALGHPGYWGYAWYRIRVRVNTPPGTKLALAGPADVDDAYQFFNNGTLTGSFGEFAANPPKIYYTQPMMFPLPPSAGAGQSSQVLAFRFYMLPNTLLQFNGAGGIHTAPLLGEAGAVTAQHQMQWNELERAYMGSFIEAIVFSMLGLVAFSLVLFDRSDHVYLWIGALLLLIGIDRTMGIIGIWTLWIPANNLLVVRQVIFNALFLAGWVMVWRVWFQSRRLTWVPRLLPVLVALLIISNCFGQNLFVSIMAPSSSHVFFVAALFLRLAVAVLLIFTVVEGIRTQGLEGWIVLPPVILAGVSEFYTELQFAHILEFWFPFGVQITSRQLASLLLVAVLALLLMRRLLLSVRRQRRMALDFKQAQEVQQVILPEAHTVLPGLLIESEYHPAREVGGDFFQIIPHHSDGSLLIVAGDVTGKGLKAGMLVALLVGAIRTVAQFDSNPLVMLDALNQRLLGRGDSQATCLVLRIAAGGQVTLANAGHMPPYLNSEQLPVEGALPLGIIERPDFTVTRFRLMENDKLVLLSDGIVEATDANGNLFGFERVHKLLHSVTTAAEIAAAAQSFGQEDDISVISVTRTSVLEPAAV